MARGTKQERKQRDAAFSDFMDSLRPDYEVRKAMIGARVRVGLSQRELARRMKTSQSVIARLERGFRSPNVKTLRRMAEVTGSRLVIRLEAPGASQPLNLG
jgi:ribosome-binding protein aMBF1 (putative translation factor)